MPKVAQCTFARCAHGLQAKDRDRFTLSEGAHWRACHVDEVIKFECPYSKNWVRIRRDPESQTFLCVCNSRILSSGSVKRHYTKCQAMKHTVLHGVALPPTIEMLAAIKPRTDSQHQTQQTPEEPQQSVRDYATEAQASTEAEASNLETAPALHDGDDPPSYQALATRLDRLERKIDELKEVMMEFVRSQGKNLQPPS